MKYHMLAFFCGFVLDLIFGDPHSLPHPICWIGRLISAFERRLLGDTDSGKNGARENEFRKGLIMAAAVPVITSAIAALLLFAAYRIHAAAGLVMESVMTYQILAIKSLRDESMKVYDELESGDLAAARAALSMIVGRDTERLDAEGVIIAAVETVSENTTDGVIAPMLYLALGGPAAGFFYKAVNTMDSMVGYKNERYLYFGRAAARLDDVLNFIPSRLAALLMIASSIGGEFSAGGALRVFLRDRNKPSSPNSGQTESVCSGALGIRLGGGASYFGKAVDKPYIGDAARPAEREDIRRANRLMARAAVLCESAGLAIMACMLWRM